MLQLRSSFYFYGSVRVVLLFSAKMQTVVSMKREPRLCRRPAEQAKMFWIDCKMSVVSKRVLIWKKEMLDGIKKYL